MESIALNLISSLIFFLLGFFVAGVHRWWVWKKRLSKIEQINRDNEVAICIRVGSPSDPLPDVKRFLKEKRPAINSLLIYNVTTGNLDELRIAQRVVEDIVEGLRVYGKGEVTRVHYFPAGMIAYSSLLPAIISNWVSVVVYHKKSDTYVPLYEIDKELKNRDKRKLKPIKAWESVSLVDNPESHSIHAEREVAQIVGSAGSGAGE